ncbi:DUF2336 domain-containing protein [Mangrovicella endophytica]|uniref:DUF2336 domain-containing protein n=1 Tax=Mangrovicella endophytica TaxID=2066697 RepID=UPI000C9DF1EB|nr:DUF2336 domain-containing protein [Mangrovicella endophytica]
MMVQRFLAWCDTAGASERAAGVTLLAEAWTSGQIASADRALAESVLILSLDDPSPKVRKALAGALAHSAEAPRALILALLADTTEIAAYVARCSPLLEDDELLELATAGEPRMQAAVAARSHVGRSIAAALVEHASRDACAILLRNRGAVLTRATSRRLAERFGSDPEIRSQLASRDDLPADVRQALIVEVSNALAAHPLVRATLGAGRAERVAFDSCERATAQLAASIEHTETAALVEHLRASGQLSTAFLLRAVCAGNIDLFAAALAALGRVSERRLQSVLVDGREAAFTALVASCGLPRSAAPLFLAAVQLWREVARGRLSIDPSEMPQRVMERVVRNAGRSGIAGQAEFDGAMALLRRLSAEGARDLVRERAWRLAA